MVHMQARRRLVLVLIMLICPSMLTAGSLGNGQAKDGKSGLESNSGTGAVVEYSMGLFDGYDPKAKRVWINDVVYILHPTYKVIGSPTMAGTITAIKEGEVVQFVTTPNPEHPTIPFVIEIRRQ